MLGFFVVNGKLEIFAFRRVAALNKVVFPVFVFPIMAIVNKEKTLNYTMCVERYKNTELQAEPVSKTRSSSRIFDNKI